MIVTKLSFLDFSNLINNEENGIEEFRIEYFVHDFVRKGDETGFYGTLALVLSPGDVVIKL